MPPAAVTKLAASFDEEPAVSAFLHRGIDHSMRHRPGIIDPVPMVGPATRAGDIGGRTTGEDGDFVLLLGEVADGKGRG